MFDDMRSMMSLGTLWCAVHDDAGGRYPSASVNVNVNEVRLFGG